MQTLIKSIKKERQIRNETYFNNLYTNTCSKHEFILGQQSFYHAVIFFSRPMLALASRLQSYEQRWSIIENCVEEHGNGLLNNSHGSSFKQFMESLTSSPHSINKYTNATKTFNKQLMDICLLENPIIGICTLGIIEDYFSEISDCIGQFVINNHWIKPEDLVHYSVHKTLDIQHAQEFYSLVEKDFEINKQDIEKGLRLGQSIFLDYYEALYFESKD